MCGRGKIKLKLILIHGKQGVDLVLIYIKRKKNSTRVASLRDEIENEAKGRREGMLTHKGIRLEG